MFCRSLFVLLYFFFWPLCCLFFFDIRNLITPLVSSNSSLNNEDCFKIEIYTYACLLKKNGNCISRVSKKILHSTISTIKVSFSCNLTSNIDVIQYNSNMFVLESLIYCFGWIWEWFQSHYFIFSIIYSLLKFISWKVRTFAKPQLFNIVCTNVCENKYHFFLINMHMYIFLS
jgi:hypothetical protein